jgi:hypothetical protein
MEALLQSAGLRLETSFLVPEVLGSSTKRPIAFSMQMRAPDGNDLRSRIVAGRSRIE